MRGQHVCRPKIRVAHLRMRSLGLKYPGVPHPGAMVHIQFTMAIVITSINGTNHSIIIGKNDERHGPFLGPSQS
jgi:hypothetical protein